MRQGVVVIIDFTKAYISTHYTHAIALFQEAHRIPIVALLTFIFTTNIGNGSRFLGYLSGIKP